MKFAVFGNPIAHSLSPAIHQQFAKQFSLKISYEKILSDMKHFSDDLYKFLEEGQGANITVPFKEVAYQLVDNLTDRARMAGAINIIKVNANGNLFGDNTDGEGLIADFVSKNINLCNSKVLIFGSGGAVRGILEPILKRKPKIVVLTNRTITKAFSLAQDFSHLGSIQVLEQGDIKDQFDLIINATSVSLQNSAINFPKDIFYCDSVCYDLSYKLKEKTSFIEWALANGCKHCFDGLGMLVFQASLAFEFWTNYKPDANKVLNFLSR